MAVNSSSETLDNKYNLDYVNFNMRQAVLPVTVLVGIENIVGLLGNVLIILVYSKRSEKSNFRYFVLFMALIDLTSCLTCVPGEVFSQLNWYKYDNWEWICKVKSFFNVLGAWGSASILLLLAFDRQRKICRPLAWQIQPSLALKLCSAAVLISIVVAAPITVLWGKQTYLYRVDGINVNVSVCEKSSEFSEDTYYPFVYITCVYIPVALMMVVITILNVLAAKKLFCDSSHQLTETCSSTTLSQTNNSSSSVSINTISEMLSTQETVPGTVIRNETAPDTRCSSRDDNMCNGSGNARRFSSELTAVQNGGHRTASVTFITPNDITLESDVGNTLPSERYQQHRGHGPNERRVSIQNSKGLLASKVATRFDGGRASISVNRTGTVRRAGSDIRLKRKTIIMLVLTTVFVITLSIYITLISVVAEKNILQTISNSEKAVYFLFLRLYFVNCVLNPLLYGFLDPRFRNGVRHLFCRR